LGDAIEDALNEIGHIILLGKVIEMTGYKEKLRLDMGRDT
jgi:hypothetical protein